MKSIVISATKDKLVIYPEIRDQMGLRAASPPFWPVDPALPHAELGKCVKEVLQFSSLDQKTNPKFIDHGDELLKMMGIRTWAEMRKKAACGRVDDNDSGTLDFTPMKPDGAGYSSVKRARVSIPIDSSPEEVGKALSDLVRKSLQYANSR